MSEESPIHRKKRTRRVRTRPPFLKPRFLLVSAVVIWLGVLLALSLRVASDDFSRPLGTPLMLPEQTLLETLTPDAVADAGSGNIPHPAAPSTSQPICGGPPHMLVLLIGSDTTTTAYIRGLADTIRVVRFDFMKSELTMLSVPRALWVESPSLSPYHDILHEYFGDAPDSAHGSQDQSATYSMLNTTYFYGNLYGLPGGGASVLAEAIAVNLGLRADHYVAVNQQIVVDMVNAIGGVDIEVPYDTGDFSAGLHHMTGEEVLSFARTREADNDWYRVERQDIALRAVWDKMMQPAYFAQIPALVDRLIAGAQTDLSKAQIASLICLISRVEQGDVRPYSISPDMVTAGSSGEGFFILLPDEEKIAPMIRQFLAGE
jgi:LCP family protein required for cell wall assembly